MNQQVAKMMNLPNPFKVFVTPEYLFRPEQIPIRVARGVVRRVPVRTQVVLPWGAPLWIHPSEVIGSNIWYYGVFDLLVAEPISRLLAPGETAVDVGANIGQMTSLMCCRAGERGRVFAWEPHGELFRELVENLSNAPDGYARAHVRQAAVGRRIGNLTLSMGVDWNMNRGTAKLSNDKPDGASKIEVAVETLDGVLSAAGEVHMLKVDVEGFERDVFEGARALLAARRIRDILFEDLANGKTGVAAQLKGFGYSVFGLSKGLLRPKLIREEEVPEGTENFLATIDPKRARLRMQGVGWTALRR